jgi:hypothetical protein
MKRRAPRTGAAPSPAAVPGRAVDGVPFDPAAPVPPFADADEASRPRALPAPQTPISAAEVERLKQQQHKKKPMKSVDAVPVAGQRDPATRPPRK